VSQLAGRAFHSGFRTEVIARPRKQPRDIPILEMAAHEPRSLGSDEIDILPRNRCGRPLEDGFRRGRKNLFLAHLLRLPRSSPGIHITWFAVVREMIFSFWEDDIVVCGMNEERRRSGVLTSDVEADTEDACNGNDESAQGAAVDIACRRMSAVTPMLTYTCLLVRQLPTHVPSNSPRTIQTTSALHPRLLHQRAL